MLPGWVIIVTSFTYLGILFAIAYYGDKRADAGRSIIANPYVYSLSLGVYATAWTFYGSVGRAASNGVGFLPIYLGPTLMIALWWLVLRKIIRISKVNRITSLADFIGSRYGKSALLAGLASVIAVVGIVPYISLQLKAVSTSFTILLQYPQIIMPIKLGAVPVLSDTALYVALLLAAFTILFGTRHLDASERHEGMVAAIAFESLVKLLAFLAVGFFVTFGIYNGFADIFTRAAANPCQKRRPAQKPASRPGRRSGNTRQVGGRDAGHAAQEHAAAAVLLLQAARSHMGRHAAGDLGHRGQQGQRALRARHRLIGDRDHAGGHQLGGLHRIGRQMQIGEQNLPGPKLLALDRERLLDLFQ
jgi:hypothetical protein